MRFSRTRLFGSFLAAGLMSACADIPSTAVPARQPVAAATAPVLVRLLALNDFHGQLPPGRRIGGRLAGGAAVLAAYLHEAERGAEDHTLIVDAGDMVGASSLTSSLLKDEPTIMFLNEFANASCRTNRRMDPHCNMVGTLGNHEFDRGVKEMLRLNLGEGGTAVDGPFLENPWRGTRFPLVSANVVSADTGKPILPPYVIKKVHYRDPTTGHSGEVPIAFIGATVRGTPYLTSPANVAGVRFLDEAESVNRYIPEIHAKGVHAIVLLIHQGGSQAAYKGYTDDAHGPVEGNIVDIVKHLDDGIDIVCSAHTHQFTNAMLPDAAGKPVLVTQAFAYSTAFARIDLRIDPRNDEIVGKRAEIVDTFADRSPGNAPDRVAANLVAQADARIGKIADRRITRIDVDFTRDITPGGESMLGDLIADAARTYAHADFGFVNAGSIRDDLRTDETHDIALPPGTITYKDIYAVQPFRNNIVELTLSGQQIYDLLDQQFAPYRTVGRSVLFVSGLTYVWNENQNGPKVTVVRKDGRPIDRKAMYTVAVNNFLAAGGDRFTVLKETHSSKTIGGDIDALEAYMRTESALTDGILAPPPLGERVTRLD